MRMLALDIGGANLKAASAMLDDEGRLQDLSATAVPFALWLAPDALSERLRAVAASTHAPDVILATMTGELCDCFDDRRQGVAFIASQLRRAFASEPVHVWSVDDGYIPLQDAADRWLSVASANWHILATHLAQQAGGGVSLMIDIGSTTTDIVLLRDGEVEAQGRTDEARLKTGEMIYTGVRRTPVMALAGTVKDECDPPPMMAERFATMADVHVLLGDLAEDPSDTDTADGRPLTKRCAANRLLRNIGSDLAIGSMEAALALAKRLAARQTAMIVQGITQVTAHHLPQRIYISGSGAFLAARAAAIALPRVEVVDWAQGLPSHATQAACAVALLHQWAARHHAEERPENACKQG